MSTIAGLRGATIQRDNQFENNERGAEATTDSGSQPKRTAATHVRCLCHTAALS